MNILGISLDDWQKMVQIVFYVTLGIITVWSFSRAKKGLLSTVNTEYHKKVIERLDELSKTLLDEYPPDSPNFWGKRLPVVDAVDYINKTFDQNKEEILKVGKFTRGIPGNPDYQRLSILVQRVKSDPFIPQKIRDKVTDLLENRAQVINEVHLHELENYMDDLVKGKYKENLDWNKYVIHNKVLHELIERGCGIDQIEEEVHKIRLAIQKYFERFQP